MITITTTNGLSLKLMSTPGGLELRGDADIDEATHTLFTGLEYFLQPMLDAEYARGEAAGRKAETQALLNVVRGRDDSDLTNLVEGRLATLDAGEEEKV